MRILVVISSLRGGGAERVASILSREWAESHDVTIAVFDGRRVAYEGSSGFRVGGAPGK